MNKEGLRIANQTIVQSITDEAKSKNMPKRYIDGIWSDFEGGKIRIGIDFKGEKLEPLDIFFEEGTKRHFIKPVAKKALRFFQNGIRYFSKGDWVGGIAAQYVFSNGFAKGYPEFKTKLKGEIEKKLKETMMFG